MAKESPEGETRAQKRNRSSPGEMWNPEERHNFCGTQRRGGKWALGDYIV